MNDETLFHLALEKPPDERAALLDAVCDTDAELRRRVERLLAEHDRGESFILDTPPSNLSPTVEMPISEEPGTLIGPFKLLQQIGEGGMGVVFMAEQTRPVRRKVALKIIKPGMDTRQVIARFEAERQALALMDHPNIARVLDAGATEHGRPYFVMELVNGLPITTYCDSNLLSLRDRLELFIPVCQAIQHAHQKGIIHRDIKPSNVMVTLYDGRPVPKVIDFGIAKATEQRLIERTMFTEYGSLVGTLEYMSPEQAEMSALGADTRSDIFSLGVLLYELLTGSTPLSRKRLQEAAYGEALRMIREDEPAKPSTWLSTAGHAIHTISTQRDTEPAKLAKMVRGELDWIVMKCLEKDRSRRYETADAFASDVRRYLDDEQVQACPASAMYRFSKFARRNKGSLAILSTAAAGLCLTAIGLAVSNVWISRETAQKDQALREKGAALLLAEQRAQDARNEQAVAIAAQRKARENLQDARAAVDQMLTRVADRLIAVPQMEEVRRDLLKDALAFYEKFQGQQAADPTLRLETAWAHRRLAELYFRLGARREAEQSFRTSLLMFDELAAESPLEPATLHDLVPAHLQFARVLLEVGNREQHEKHLRIAVNIAEGLVSAAPENVKYRNLLVGAHINLLTQTQLSDEQRQDMLLRNLTLTDDEYLLGHLHFHLANLAARCGDDLQAKREFQEALRCFESLLPIKPSTFARHDVASTLVCLAELMETHGLVREADDHYRRAISLFDSLAGDYPAFHHYRIAQADTRFKYARYLKKVERVPEALQAYQGAVDLSEKLAHDFDSIAAYRTFLANQRLELGAFLIEAGQASNAHEVPDRAHEMSAEPRADFAAWLEHRQATPRLSESRPPSPISESASAHANSASEANFNSNSSESARASIND